MCVVSKETYRNENLQVKIKGDINLQTLGTFICYKLKKLPHWRIATMATTIL